MVRRQRQERGAEQRIRAGREDFDRVVCADNRPIDPGPFRAADPVLLHQPDALGPAVQRLYRVEQFLAEFGDAQKPLRQEALFDERPGAPSAPVDDLLVGQHGMIDRVPVDPAFTTIGEPRRKKIKEHLLFVAVVFGVAGRDLARPVIGEPHPLQLPAHRRDVLGRPFGRMDVAGDRGVLGRQSERVPTHRVQHVVALGAAVARDEVAHRVVAHVPDMQFAGGIREHFEDIVFWARLVLVRLEYPALTPGPLPLDLVFTEVVARHACSRHGRPTRKRAADCCGYLL